MRTDGTIYSVSSPPKVPWICDICGGNVVQRADDTEESVRKRLATYNEQTAPLLAWFEERGLLATVDGVGDPDEIFGKLVALIDERTHLLDRLVSVTRDAPGPVPDDPDGGV